MITQRTFKEQPKYSVLEPLLMLQPHVHSLDMPFRISSNWQQQRCTFSIWQGASEIVAWSVFQPAWSCLDFAVSKQYLALSSTVVRWGRAQLQALALRQGKQLTGHAEMFEDAPDAEPMVNALVLNGFTVLAETTSRFKLDLQQDFSLSALEDFTIRPVKEDAYKRLVDEVFGPSWMTVAWLEHPTYLRDLDLVAATSTGEWVGFCCGWQQGDVGQLEPLGVHPNYRGLGLGRALELTLAWVMQAVASLFVDHGSNNEKAIAFLRRVGFRPYKTILRYARESE